MKNRIRVKVKVVCLMAILGLSWSMPVMAEPTSPSSRGEDVDSESSITGSGASSKINLSQIVPALEAYKKNEALFNNPEALEAYLRVVKAMSAKNQ